MDVLHTWEFNEVKETGAVIGWHPHIYVLVWRVSIWIRVVQCVCPGKVISLCLYPAVLFCSDGRECNWGYLSASEFRFERIQLCRHLCNKCVYIVCVCACLWIMHAVVFVTLSGVCAHEECIRLRVFAVVIAPGWAPLCVSVRKCDFQ